MRRAWPSSAPRTLPSRTAGSRPGWTAPPRCSPSCPGTCGPPRTAGRWPGPAGVACTGPRGAGPAATRAATRVRDLYATEGARASEVGGDFAGEAERLGAATAQVHRDLAEAFGRSSLQPEAIRELAEQMFRRLDIAVATVPELARHADKIGEAYSQLAKLTDQVPAQRVHGDYHLGQVMRTQTGWVVLDFEERRVGKEGRCRW